MKRSIAVSAVAISIGLVAGFAWPADPVAPRGDVKSEDHEPIFGGRMMTAQERAEYHAKMRAATTVAERKRVRKEQHDAMMARAKERGVTIVEEPSPAK
jgi:hypothetical protein